MPKRKTADVTAETPVAAEPRKRASAAKPKTAAATHKRTSPSKKSSVVAETVAAVVSEPVALVSEPAAVTVAPEVRTRPMPTHDEIAARAYSYWEARGFQSGCPTEDWLRAERELLQAE